MAKFSDNKFIGIDCLALPEKFSGAAFYIYYLTTGILAASRAHPVAVICKPQHAPLFEPHLSFGDKILTVPLRNQVEKLAFYEFRLKQLLLRENICLFYATHYLCPPRDEQYKIINTVHDMGFLRYPQYYPLVKRFYFGMRMRNVLNRADQLVAVSKSTAAAICGRFPELAQKITVAYPGTDHLCSISKGAAPIANGKPKAPYILAVNTFEIRKNIPFIIRLFEHLKRELRLPHQLMLVGQPANDFRRVMNCVAQSPFKNEITVTNWISNEKLVECYRHCDFFINASAYEGFGFTPFEAISSGCPVFLFKNNTVAEIFGDHPYVIDNYDVESWKTIIDLAIRSGFAEKISARQISHLTWQRAAETVMPLIHHTISTRENSFVS